MTCHDEFTAAGTVFPMPDSSCSGQGVSGVSVEFLDEADHTALSLVTNAAGNFFTKEALPRPYRIRITAQDGTTRHMKQAQTDGSCSHCHRLPPVDEADGRISLAEPRAQDAGRD